MYRPNSYSDPISASVGGVCRLRHYRFLYLQQPFTDRTLLLGNGTGSVNLPAYRHHTVRDDREFPACDFLRYPDCRPALVQPGSFRDTGTLSGGTEQSAEISAGTASDRMAGGHPDNNHCSRYVRRRIRQHHEPVYQFYYG